VRKTVSDLGRFARADELTRTPIDLGEALETAIRMSAHQIQHHAMIVRELGATPLVLASHQGLEQVFINLLINASQAMPAGRPQANRIRVATRTDAEGRAVVEIEDTGAGITLEDCARIFDPFFTTKPIGFGTGLGLSISHRIISDFGGTIAVESEVGRGALFRIVLPPAPSKSTTEAAPAEAPPPDRAAPRAQILVVDDEPRVLTMLDRVLSRRHDVTLASDGSEALALIKQGRRFDLVLCDLMMPIMTGMELFERVEELDAEQAGVFVFLSGGAVTQRGEAFLEKHAARRFDKPFQLRDLDAMIAAKLAEQKE
jgi:CheY-like chemotaxis protein